MVAELKTAFWNVENLFEVNQVPRAPKTAAELDIKVGRLADAINQFFDHQGPDLLGLAEIHTDRLLRELASRLNHGPYLRLWSAPGTSNQTGLAALARESTFSTFSIVAEQRPKIADRPRVLILHCELRGKPEPFLFIVNHWKSRMPSYPISDSDQRRESADWLGNFLARSKRWSCAIVMGDFNAEPFEAPFGELRLRCRRFFSSALWSRATPAYLYNASWRMLSEPDYWETAGQANYREPRPKTSHGEGTPLMIDQLFVSGRALRGGSLSLRERTVALFCADKLTSAYNRNGKLHPAKWTYVSASEYTGTSDHLPLLAAFDVH